MSIQSSTRAAFAGVKRSAPESVVEVSYKGTTCSGLRAATRRTSAPSMNGNKGDISGSVRVDATELGSPDEGDTIRVGGLEVFVSESRMDAVGAIMTIDYTETSPFEEGV